MALVGDSEARRSHFETLWQFCFPAAKILITGRPNFFLDDREMRAALGISKATATGPYCEALTLEPFSLEQIDTALRESPVKTRRDIVEFARKDNRFKEIVSRGSLLYVVSQLWQREQLFKYAGRITSAFVMELFIQHSYRRQADKSAGAPSFMILNEAERTYFMNGIAATMAAIDLPNQITRDQFEGAVKKLYEIIPTSLSTSVEGLPRKGDRPLRERLKDAEEPLQDIVNDVRATGLLVPDESKRGALRFAHKSFMEYLLAKVYADHIIKRNREATSAIVSASKLKAKHILDHDESTAFFAEIIIGSLKSEEAQRTALAGEGSQLLFETIVLRPLGSGVLARLRAKLAVMSLKISARTYNLIQRCAPGFWTCLVFRLHAARAHRNIYVSNWLVYIYVRGESVAYYS